jgi:hypothetical protein
VDIEARMPPGEQSLRPLRAHRRTSEDAPSGSGDSGSGQTRTAGWRNPDVVARSKATWQSHPAAFTHS